MITRFPCGHARTVKNTQRKTIRAFNKKLGRVKEYQYEFCRQCMSCTCARPDLHP